MPNLEFNEDHKKTNITSNPKFKKLVDKIKLGAGVGVAIVIAAGAVISFGPVEETPIVTHEMESLIKESDLKVNSEILNNAQEIDGYNTVDNILDSYCAGDSNRFYKDIDKYMNQDKIPSLEEFKQSIQKTEFNFKYMYGHDDGNRSYSDFSEEEKESFKEEMYSDYAIITQYMNENEDDSYDNIYNFIIENKLKKAMQEKGIHNISLNNIDLVDTKSGEEIEIDLTVNNENLKLVAGGYLAEALDNLEKGDRAKYLSNLKRRVCK